MAGGIIGGIAGGVMNAVLPGVNAVLPTVADTVKILVDRFVPDPQAKAQAEAELSRIMLAREQAIAEAVTKQNESQSAVNLAEAQGNDKFSARWRPAIGWICGASMAWTYLVAPALTWVGSVVGVIFGFPFPVPPTVPMDELWPVLIGLLGLGAMRTVERTAGVPGALPPKG